MHRRALLMKCGVKSSSVAAVAPVAGECILSPVKYVNMQEFRLPSIWMGVLLQNHFRQECGMIVPIAMFEAGDSGNSRDSSMSL